MILDQILRHCCYCGRGLKRTDLMCNACWNELLLNELPSRYEVHVLEGIPIFPIFLWDQHNKRISNLIYSLKSGGPDEIYERLCQLMAFKNYHSRYKDFIITCAPSSTQNKKDHAFQLANGISKELRIPFKPCFVWEKNKGLEHKYLGRKDRFLHKMTYVGPRADKNLKILFVDDVVTTGATVRVAFSSVQGPKNFEAWCLACRI